VDVSPGPPGQRKDAGAFGDQVSGIARHLLPSRVEVTGQEDLASVGEALARILAPSG